MICVLYTICLHLSGGFAMKSRELLIIVPYLLSYCSPRTDGMTAITAASLASLEMCRSHAFFSIEPCKSINMNNDKGPAYALSAFEHWKSPSELLRAFKRMHVCYYIYIINWLLFYNYISCCVYHWSNKMLTCSSQSRSPRVSSIGVCYLVALIVYAIGIQMFKYIQCTRVLSCPNNIHIQCWSYWFYFIFFAEYNTQAQCTPVAVIKFRCTHCYSIMSGVPHNQRTCTRWPCQSCACVDRDAHGL